MTVTAPVGDCPGELTNGDNHACAITFAGELHNWTFVAQEGDFVTLNTNRESGSIQPRIRLVSPTGELLGSQAGGTSIRSR